MKIAKFEKRGCAVYDYTASHESFPCIKLYTGNDKVKKFFRGGDGQRKLIVISSVITSVLVYSVFV